MNNRSRLQKIVAPIALGIGLAMGVSTSAVSHPRHYDSSNYNRNYHQRSFIEIQPFRSLNVTPRYYQPSPGDNSRYYDNNHDHPRQRRVHRRGYRKPVSNRRYGNRYDRYNSYDGYDGTYIRIRIK